MRLLTPHDLPRVTSALNRYAYILAPGAGRLSAEPFFSTPGNVGFSSDDAGALALFHAFGGGRYEAHLICDPPYRGARAVAFGAEAVAVMFTALGASCITAVIPRDNTPSRRVCRAIGGIPTADTVGSLGRRCVVYTLDHARWVTFSAELRKA